MANLDCNRLLLAEQVSARRLDFRPAGKVCWSDLVDDQTTDPGDSPRSICSSRQGPDGEPDLVKSTRWVDMEDSDTEFEETTVGTDDAMVRIDSPLRSQVLQGSRSENLGNGGAQTQQDVFNNQTGPYEKSRSPPWKYASQVGRKGDGKARSEVVEKSGKGWQPSNKGVRKSDSKGEGWQQSFSDERSFKGGNNGNSWQQKASDWRSGKSGNKGNGRGAGHEKFQCQFILGIEDDTTFRVVKRVLGTSGANMKSIAEESGAKLRLRGRGSHFLEGPEQKEADEDLMLCVSSQDAKGFEVAKRAVSNLLERIYHQYRVFCRRAGHSCSDLQLQIHEGYRAGSR